MLEVVVAVVAVEVEAVGVDAATSGASAGSRTTGAMARGVSVSGARPALVVRRGSGARPSVAGSRGAPVAKGPGATGASFVLRAFGGFGGLRAPRPLGPPRLPRRGAPRRPMVQGATRAVIGVPALGNGRGKVTLPSASGGACRGATGVVASFRLPRSSGIFVLAARGVTRSDFAGVGVLARRLSDAQPFMHEMPRAQGRGPTRVMRGATHLLIAQAARDGTTGGRRPFFTGANRAGKGAGGKAGRRAPTHRPHLSQAATRVGAPTARRLCVVPTVSGTRRVGDGSCA